MSRSTSDLPLRSKLQSLLMALTWAFWYLFESLPVSLGQWYILGLTPQQSLVCIKNSHIFIQPIEHKIALTDRHTAGFWKEFMKLQQNERHYKFYTMNETCFLSSFHSRENFAKPISGVSHIAVIYLLLWFHLACGVAKDRGQQKLLLCSSVHIES